MQALWSFIIAGVGFTGTLMGTVQYVYSGEVSTRPGVLPVAGQAALGLLLGLFVGSAVFAGLGIIFRRIAARHDAR
jgi:hypothetical protein